MKKILFFASLFVFVIYLGSCKKCYHCTNTCTLCTLAYGGHTVSSQVLCTDSFATVGEYKAAISADSAQGYVCAATSSTYSYDFCDNKPAEGNKYINYFNEGGRANCTLK